ncbi:MCE family protein [Antrihabitans sp. YC3-6]|uniref:MCE family protein n=1 Tax=Antrihabitans stalagmiti TaxID=2799499 RepID=A0A934U5Y4_9NOCA|nr:MlaD family protein [Antrihabitans stalagmiti]MBJ8342014.1 MCE family protein [Antrihabitans stalagmiti]
MNGRSQRGLVARLLVFTALIGVLLAGIVIAIQRPVDGSTRTFEALFTDASGLRENADVRMFGVAVGKVTSIELDGNQARVQFTVVEDRPMFDTSVVAIRYQNLTGQRYVDVKQPDSAGSTLGPGTVIGTDHTIPSFDITALFNGMEPVLAEFSPAAVNQFLENAIAVIEGDGKAVGSTLDAIDKLSAFVTDRQQVISLLLRNFEQVYQQLGGKSPETATLIRGISDVFVNLQKQFEGLMDFVDIAPSVLGPLNNLLAALGFTQPDNPDLQNDLRLLFPDPQTTIDLLNKLPGLLQSLTNLMPDPNNPINTTCANGSADVPGIVAVLIAGQQVSICNG